MLSTVIPPAAPARKPGSLLGITRPLNVIWIVFAAVASIELITAGVNFRGTDGSSARRLRALVRFKVR
jgi:hypothetical protein